MLEIDWSPNDRTVRQFGAIAVAGFAAMGAVSLWTLHMPLLAAAVTLSGLALFACSRLYPAPARWAYVGLCVVAYPVGMVVSHILLAGVYYLVMTPIGQWCRLRRRDALQRRLQPDSHTYWQPLEPPSGGASYLKQF